MKDTTAATYFSNERKYPKFLANIVFFKARLLILILCLICNSITSQAQVVTDSLVNSGNKKISLKKEILPLSFIVTGSALNYSSFRYFVRAEIGNTTNIRLDNYIQYAPIAEVYLADLTRIKHRNSAWDQTKYLAISEIVTSAVIQSLKLLTRVTRPNGGTLSFPSGHTSNAFTSATVLFNEFRDSSLPIALSGYGFSTATGILRITNNRHWISDVLAGAGIGILVADMVYYWKPLKNWQPFRSASNLSFVPEIRYENNIPVFGLSMNFK